MKPFQLLFTRWWSWMQSHKQILQVGKRTQSSQRFSQKIWCHYWIYVFSHTRGRGQPQNQLPVINCSQKNESAVVLGRTVLLPWVSSGAPSVRSSSVTHHLLHRISSVCSETNYFHSSSFCSYFSLLWLPGMDLYSLNTCRPIKKPVKCDLFWLYSLSTLLVQLPFLRLKEERFKSNSQGKSTSSSPAILSCSLPLYLLEYAVVINEVQLRLESAAFVDESHICICFTSLFILLKPKMNFVPFGEGLLLVQFPDAALKKRQFGNQIFQH